jgi:thiol-disulfide isomerase/thioredoxin
MRISNQSINRLVLPVLLVLLLAVIAVLLHRPHLLMFNPASAAAADSNSSTTDFPAGFTWINTPTPLSFQHQLKGQVVLLDFWTYGCINCQHLIPTLDQLQRHFAGRPFVIIGVHSAKFANESSAQNVREAVLRYRINHPVIVDQNMQIWNMFNVNAWPTLVLIGADGSIAADIPGEAQYADLEQAVQQTLDADQAAGTLAAAPLVLPAQQTLSFASGLFFPGKVLADAAGRRLFIADTGHNRIVVASWPDAQGHAKLLAAYGSGAAGTRDGLAAQAEFNSPQGMALGADGLTLYVADTRNHLIRAIDLATQNVRTILGNSQEVYDTAGGGYGTAQGINSPWDLAPDGNTLFIAMAGEHQIWRMNLQTTQATPFAGSGQEGLQDDLGTDAQLAQPSGLALVGNTLYFADSENSALRGVNLDTGEVVTLVGHGLFDFGDVDGNSQTALLQHDLGVAVYNGKLLVADTYNHKLRLVDPNTDQVSTFAGSGQPGTGVPGGKIEFYEPGGLSVARNTIFVADTDNQRIVMIDATTGRWHELTIDGLTSPAINQDNIANPADQTPASATTIQVALNPSEPLQISAAVRLPIGTHLTPGVPVSLRLTDAKANILGQQTISSDGKLPFHFVLPVQNLPTDAPQQQWDLQLYYVYCTGENSGMCIPAQVDWRLNVQLESHDATNKLTLSMP